MKEVIIKYRSNKTLEALKDLGKYLGFSVSDMPTTKTSKQTFINGVTVIKGDERIDLSELNTVFTGKGFDARDLRKAGWQRKE